MSINNFIPSIWSETLAKELDREYIAVRHCNRDFSGEITGKGDVVYVNSLNGVNVFDYTKDTDMLNAQALTASQREIRINQAKAFNFQIDDVNQAQSHPKLLSAAMKGAADALSNVADRFIYSMHSQIWAAHTVTATKFTAENAVDTILKAREKLMMANVSSNIETVLEVSPAVAAVIMKAKIMTGNENGEVLDNGYIGSFLGFRVYVSNNIAQDGLVYKCFARTTRAIAFAEQLSEIEAYRPEKRFADAVKGLHLYGASIIYPGELILLNLTV